MKLHNTAFLSAGLLPLLAGCVTTPLALAPVGPQTTRPAAPVSPGELQVFSATVKSIPTASDDLTCFDLHTGYAIHDAAGQTLTFVPNHDGNLDEWPDQVPLPAGHYTVLAQSARFGLVSVPVAIQAGATTIVRLE
jgi:hypothetical protein